MRHRVLALAALLAVMLFSVTFFTAPSLIGNEHRSLDEAYVGVAFCGNSTAEARLLIDRVKTYTNLFIVQSGPVSWNESSLNEICDYAVDSGLKIIVYFGDLNPTVLERNGTTWRINWVNTANMRWGDNFLGLYYYDEWGGTWLDTIYTHLEEGIETGVNANWTSAPWWSNANATYDSIASRFLRGMQRELGFVPSRESFKLFVSDYALYWYDYLGGYDVVFAEIGWNHSLAQDIALIRGAASMQNKDWGAIITWKYTTPPYLDSGETIYSQMVSAYTAGAKYITIFNYPSLEGNAYGIMQDEHFAALERFWKDATTGSIQHDSVKAEVALILPNNYGWGMRHTDDRIWGFWGPDEKSPQIWSISRQLLTKYGTLLDIIYDDPQFPIGTKYTQVYLWNATLPIEG